MTAEANVPEAVKRIFCVSCEVFRREMEAARARSRSRVDIEFLPKGLHELTAKAMRARIQQVLDRVDPDAYDAITLGFGLCSRGIEGLTARSLPLVVARAHDCITLFLGSSTRYLEYFLEHPGTSFRTSGWIERRDNPDAIQRSAIRRRLGLDLTPEELVARYGEDNARYLLEELGDLDRNHDRLAFIEMGVEPDDRFERQARAEAEEHGWTYDGLKGDMSLIERLLDGPWSDDEFLVVPPGGRVIATGCDGIIDTFNTFDTIDAGEPGPCRRGCARR